TRRKLLEWETAASADRRLGAGIAQFCMAMWPAPPLAVGLGALVALARPGALPAAAPLLLAWLFSPALACWVSRTPALARLGPADADRRLLRRLARKTWAFF